MMMPQVNQSRPAETTLFLKSFKKPFIHGTTESATLPAHLPRISNPSSLPIPAVKKQKSVQIRRSVITKAILLGNILNKLTSNVNVVITVLPTIGGVLTNIGIGKGIDNAKDLLGKSLLLELVSAELDPKTGLEKERVTKYAHKTKLLDLGEVTYEVDFDIPKDFGEVGAVLVQNEHSKEMFLKDIKFDGDGLLNGPVTVSCNSWVHSMYDNPQKRVFFTNKSYLPSNTPSGLKKLREEDLKNIRGNGTGERKSFERIYDYDVYNDLGNPEDADLKRPLLGGKDHPYPRRCRTGRPHTTADPNSESRTTENFFYVPRDESFSEVKEQTFGERTLSSVLHATLPTLRKLFGDNDEFQNFTDIDILFNIDILTKLIPQTAIDILFNILPKWLPPRFKDFLTWFTQTASQRIETGLKMSRFQPPEPMDRDKFFWLRDEEFGRQTLAGLNPYSIQLVTSPEWPLKSKLDPSIYGPPASAITTEIIEQEIKGFMTVEEAIKQKKLFILDYHDLLLPYVSKVRELEGTTLYGSRTVFFLTNEGTLRPLAIELTRPQIDGKPQWKQVFTPCWDATGAWLWRLAKAHVLSHDSGIHQLVSHWLRTHCVTEPYVIATKRQLSATHPIFRLLNPHFRYTMKINALARQQLINANGIIESTFSPGKYSIELSSVAYDKLWRFDHEALPADLISRGMAVEDPNSPHGLKLTIEDYPFANDGLLIWDAIKQWVTSYVNHYYSSASQVQSDEELQAWWTEIRTVGHADKKDEQWWPDLETPNDLIKIVTTIAWVTSGHHASVNFGQYTYAGYFPNRPTIARTNVPTEDRTDEKWKYFIDQPEGTLLKCLPSKQQAIKVMVVLDVLSSHSPEEEYLGKKLEPAWGDDPDIKAAFEEFNGRLKEVEKIIDEKNDNRDLRNRHGAGLIPYELLKPFSQSGVTGKGVPYSISI